MTADATARLILHRAAKAKTGADLLWVGNALGVDSSLPPLAYQARVARRLYEMIMLANSIPYQAGRFPIVKN